MKTVLAFILAFFMFSNVASAVSLTAGEKTAIQTHINSFNSAYKVQLATELGCLNYNTTTDRCVAGTGSGYSIAVWYSSGSTYWSDASNYKGGISSSQEQLPGLKYGIVDLEQTVLSGFVYGAVKQTVSSIDLYEVFIEVLPQILGNVIYQDTLKKELLQETTIEKDYSTNTGSIFSGWKINGIKNPVSQFNSGIYDYFIKISDTGGKTWFQIGK